MPMDIALEQRMCLRLPLENKCGVIDSQMIPMMMNACLILIYGKLGNPKVIPVN